VSVEVSKSMFGCAVVYVSVHIYTCASVDNTDIDVSRKRYKIK
jgi:hypothetical protein